MKKDQAAKHLDVIKALSEGKTIQIKVERTGGGVEWSDTDDPSFSVNIEYRIKPEPRTFYLVKYSKKLNKKFFSTAHESLEEANKRLGYMIACQGVDASSAEIIEVKEQVK